MALSDVDFSSFSDEDLCSMVDDLNQMTIPEDALIRHVARRVYDREPNISMLLNLALPIATELAYRLRQRDE